MKNIRALVVLSLVSVFLAGTALANTSSINPNVPAQNSPLSSSVLRGNFGNAYADENTIYGILTLSSNQILGTVNSGNVGPLNLPSCATGALSWTPGSGFGCNSISGLVSPITQSLVFTGVASFNLNSAPLPTKQSGTALQIGNADGLASRIESDAFGAAAYFTGIRSDGTNAAPTTLQSGDEIAAFNAWGYNGSSIVGPRASVRSYAAQNWTGSAQGTYISFATALNGTTTTSEVCRFENDGGIDCPATVTGGDQGAGKINAAGFYVNGVAVLTTLPSQGANTALVALTTGVPVAGALPSCSGGSNALTWQTGVGFGCNTISGGSGSGTVNSATAGQIAYYASTGTAVSGSSAIGVTATGETLAGSLNLTATIAAPAAGSSPAIYSPTAGALGLSTSAGAAMTLTSTGSVGIGTAAPVGTLTVSDASTNTFTVTSSNATDTGFFVNNTSTGGHSFVFATGGVSNTPGNFYIYDQTSTAWIVSMKQSQGLSIPTTDAYMFSTSNAFTNPSATVDLSLSRINFNTLGIGTGTVGSSNGSVQLANIYDSGTKFTTSGCSVSSTTGGASVGILTVGANSCSVVITMSGAAGATSANGWSCAASDQTAPTILISQTSSTTHTATLSVPAGAGATDVIQFHCIGY